MATFQSNIWSHLVRSHLLAEQVIIILMKPPLPEYVFFLSFPGFFSLLTEKQRPKLAHDEVQTGDLWCSKRPLTNRSKSSDPERTPKLISGSCQTKISPVFYLYSFGCSGRSCGLWQQWPQFPGIERQEKVREVATLKFF